MPSSPVISVPEIGNSVGIRKIPVGLLHRTHLRHHRPDTSQMVLKEEHWGNGSTKAILVCTRVTHMKMVVSNSCRSR